jgi:plasmid stabilization system protein ParE
LIYKVKYSPDASDKLKELKRTITASRGSNDALKYVSSITNSVKNLGVSPLKGPSVAAFLGIETSYRFLHIYHYYIFYRVDTPIIYITDIFHEREDFMRELFGISSRTEESIDYWGE